MKNSRAHAVILLLNAAAFGFFGLKWLFSPAAMAGPLGILLTNADAVTDAQAVYGGLELGLGIFLAYCASKPAHRQIGLLAATLALGGLGLSRLAGVAMVPGQVTGATLQLLSTDLFGAVLNGVFLFGASRANATAAKPATPTP